jgi:hypothetical protein
MDATMTKAPSLPDPTTPPNQTITTTRPFIPKALIIPGSPDSDSNKTTVTNSLPSTHRELLTRLNRRRERRTKRSRRLRTHTKHAQEQNQPSHASHTDSDSSVLISYRANANHCPKMEESNAESILRHEQIEEDINE